MKRTYKYALSAVLGLGLAVPAIAQTGFPDVKDSHWAADSVNRLKLSGLVHGFKDGEYKGDRTMTRYEMASAVYAIYAKLVCFDEEIEKKIKALEAKINSIKPNEPAPAVDLSDIRAALASMKNDVGTMKQWGADLAQLKKMSSAYANELKSLGADVKEMQKNISDVQSRVSKLEMAPSGINITGDANFWMAASATANRDSGVYNQDGMYISSNPSGAGFDNLTALHEIGIKIEDKKATVPYTAEFVIGNTMNDFGGFGTQVYPDNLGQDISSNNDTVWVRELNGTYRPFNLKVGRQGVMLNKFILRRPDTTSFYMQKQWDNHEYLMDGARMNFGPDDAGSVFMGVVSNATTTDGMVFQPIGFNTQNVERMMGGTYAFKFGGDKGKITATYVDYDGSLGFVTNLTGRGEGPPPPPPSGISRTNVYGLDLNYDFGAFQFQIGGGKSVGYGVFEQNGLTGRGTDTQNLDTLIDSQNSRWDASIGSHGENHSFKLGYRNVEENYNAPGDWGRVSIFRNLTDTRAYNASASLMVTKKIGVHGWYEKGEGINGPGNYTSWKAGVETNITSKWAADFTMEDTNFKSGFIGLSNGASSKFRTVRLGYDMGDMRTFNVFWQQSELNSVAGFGDGKGAFYGFQYSLKF